MRGRSAALLVALTLAAGAPLAHGACRCTCVDGEPTALCDSSLDIEPICPPRLCPLVPPAMQPIPRPQIPPLGTRHCESRQVLRGGSYVWTDVCD